MRHGSSALAVCFYLILAGAASAQRPAAQPTSADLIRALQRYGLSEFDLRETLQQALAP
jgi:hypothetical protein